MQFPEPRSSLTDFGHAIPKYTPRDYLQFIARNYAWSRILPDGLTGLSDSGRITVWFLAVSSCLFEFLILFAVSAIEIRPIAIIRMQREPNRARRENSFARWSHGSETSLQPAWRYDRVSGGSQAR